MLKLAIRSRRNSLFYRSARGAFVADVYMTLLHAAALHGVNPVEYLTALIRNERAVPQDPARWLPWNYTSTLDAIAA